MNFSLAQKTVRNKVVPSDILFISEHSPWGRLGYETVVGAFPYAQPIYWSPGMPKPDLSDWHGDWIISFKADLILSRATLEQAKKGAINFHPSPPKYRGVGGYWWALHNGDDSFGVTCHHMDERIDNGEIITTENFPIWPSDTVESLKHRASLHSLKLLDQTLDTIQGGKALVPCGAKWAPHLYTYKELAQFQSARGMDTNQGVILNTKQAFAALEAVIKEASTNEQDMKKTDNQQVA